VRPSSIGLLVVSRGFPVDAVALQDGAHVGVVAVPHEVLGEVGRRRDADQPGDPRRPGERRQQHDPAAHGGADQDLRSLGDLIEHGDGILGPAADGASPGSAAGVA
jgi:hypothetical protein